MFLKGRPITMYMPKDQVDSYYLEARAELPSNKLKLDWVYPFASACFQNKPSEDLAQLVWQLLQGYFCRN